MKQIPLTQGKYALVDDEDFEYLNQWKWHVTRKRSNWYAQRWIGKKSILMQNVILNLTEEERADHTDGDGLNNQRYNLRKATSLQNSRNRRKRNYTKYPYKGIRLFGDKWQAYITIEKKQKHLGMYRTAEDAAAMYNQIAKQYFGEFAKLNIIGVQ